ncbi:unnamed protein product [Absidia cylindrospora]
MIRQLGQQPFLERILSSMASRHEDRFYSMLPLSDYHDKIGEVSQWNINSMVSVKLKLYDIMNTKDKLALLFWSSDQDTITHGVRPTFATSTLSSGRNVYAMTNGFSNFDLDDPTTVMLHNNNYLRLKPKAYYVATKKVDVDDAMQLACQRLGMGPTLDMVVIPAAFGPIQMHDLVLVGCFVQNKWIMVRKHPLATAHFRQCNKPATCFNIY